MWEILGNVLTVIVGAGVVNLLFDWWRTHRKEQRERDDKAAWVALQTAIVLERFAVDCLRGLNILRDVDHPDEPLPDLPEFGDYPTDADGWRSLDRDLAEKALNFPADVMIFRGVTPAETWDAEVSMRKQNFAHAAHMAALVARDLRQAYRFRAHSFVVKRTLQAFEQEALRGAEKVAR